MTAVASEGVPGTRHQLRQRLRSSVLGPRGGGTTWRRASDAFRLALAVVVVLVSIPVMRANSAAELSIVRAVHPPPAAISWLVTTVFWPGSAGVIVLLIIVGLLVPLLTAVRWMAVAGVLTWGVCALLGVVLGPTAGRPPADALAGLDTGYPVTQLAVAVAVATTALPYLSRPVHRVVSLLLTLTVLAGVCGGEALPVNAISSVALGWGVAAGLHLAVGSPLGLPSAAEITEWITDLDIMVRDITRSPRQVWGVELFTGRDEAGKTIATEPHKIVYVLAGSTLAQLLVILALGTSLHAVGQHASIATLITVNTFAGLIGGAVPIPGGLGVVEAGLIAGLTAAGIPQDQAVAAVLIQRFFTSYLPPVWGWATLAWMRRREYV